MAQKKRIQRQEVFDIETIDEAKPIGKQKALFITAENPDGTITAAGCGKKDGTITMTKKRWMLFITHLLPQLM